MFIVIFGLVIAATLGSYQGKFRSTVPITVATDRAGLTMSPGAVVKLRGVEIGRVDGVHAAETGAEVDLAIDKSKISWISKDSTAQIVPPTAFGAKYVQISSSSSKGQDTIASGAVIRATSVTVEVNEAFSNLAEVLKAAQPDKVNNAITALSSTLDGRGEKLGGLVTQLNTYLETLNSSLPKLNSDLDQADGVVGTYEKLTPNLIDLTRNVTKTSDTLVSRQKSLDKALKSADTFSATAAQFVKTIGKPLTNLLQVLDPVTSMLSRYASVLPCTLSGTVYNGQLASQVVGGKFPGINTYTKLKPSDDPYTAPNDLPKMGFDRGPDCFGMPRITQADANKPNPNFGTGANPYGGGPKSPTEGLATTFFGALAGLVNLG
ncbi:MAG: MCE family protein [Aeromicrobium sp.]